jgi:hypothetical protein
MEANVIHVRTAPDRTPLSHSMPLVFLAGSIDQGDAPDWQARVIATARAQPGLPDVVFANPRRPDWDRTWTAPMHPGLVEQIAWELDHLENSAFVLFCFTPESSAPVTLLELGAMLGQLPAERVVVVCPDTYWRFTNVAVTCGRRGVGVLPTLEAGLDRLFAALTSCPDPGQPSLPRAPKHH